MKTFVLYRNTKDRGENERESQVIDKMNSDAEQISFGTFSKYCDWAEVAKNLGYGRDLPISKDWSVSFSKSKYGGLPCYILGHSECDFIFLRPADAQMLQEAFAKDMTPMEWQRHTQYGKGAVDPRQTPAC
jgi:hypothetical protein